MSEEFIQGYFLRELKNRFLCLVLVENEPIECYVPSSSHLSNYLQLENKKVLLKRNPPKRRTQYSLFAVKYIDSYIILNTVLTNKIILDRINEKMFSFLGRRKYVFKEFNIDTYKSDLFIPESNTIIEIKSLLCDKKKGVFPTIYSERTLKQFEYLKTFLKSGYKVYLFIVALSPSVKEIIINKETEFFKKLETCENLGLSIFGFSVYMNQQFKFSLKRIKVQL